MPCVTSARAPMSDCFANDCSIQNHRAHAHEHFVPHFARMHDGAVADGDPVAKHTGIIIRQVQDRVVLNIRVMADDNAVDVAAQHRAVPDAGVGAQRHVANDRGGSCNINVLANFWRVAEKPVQLLIKCAHGAKLGQNGRHNKFEILFSFCNRLNMWQV